MGIQLNIKLDRPNKVYLDDDLVTGRVELNITGQRVRIGSLKLYVNGFSQYQTLNDDNGRHSQMIKLSKIEEVHHLFCFLNFITRDKYGDEIYLEPGDYSYPFEIKLPGALPSTMKSEYVTVIYRLALVLELPWPAPNKRVIQDITVIQELSYKHHMAPLTATGYKAFNFWCCKTLPLVAKITLSKQVFEIGSSIPFRIEVDNKSPRMIKKIQVKLMRMVQFYYKKEKRLSKVCLATVEHNYPIEPGTVYTWSDGRIEEVPFTQPNCTTGLTKVFELWYSLMVKFVPAAPLSVSLTKQVDIIVALPNEFDKERLLTLPEKIF